MDTPNNQQNDQLDDLAGLIEHVSVRPILFDVGATVATITGVSRGERTDYNDKTSKVPSIVWTLSGEATNEKTGKPERVEMEYETGTKVTTGGAQQSGLTKLLMATTKPDATNPRDLIGQRVTVIVSMERKSKDSDPVKKIAGFAPAK